MDNSGNVALKANQNVYIDQVSKMIHPKIFRLTFKK